MTISFARHQFPPAIIRRAVWLYVRFTLSYRDVEDPLAERSGCLLETVRRWVLKFGPLFGPVKQFQLRFLGSKSSGDPRRMSPPCKS